MRHNSWLLMSFERDHYYTSALHESQSATELHCFEEAPPVQSEDGRRGKSGSVTRGARAIWRGLVNNTVVMRPKRELVLF